MAHIQFKTKVQQVFAVGGELVYEYITVPVLDRKHCDMGAMRNHPKYGSYANSDLFKGMLAHIRTDRLGGAMLRLEAIPNGVLVDTTGFLAVVTLDV